MENAPAEFKESRPIVTSENGLYLDTAKFEHAWRVAKMLASTTMVPDHFRENPGNCMIALNFAERTGLDPFMIMQKMYVIKGRPGIEGQLAIALINNTGKFTPLQFRFEGEGRKRQCTCYAKNKTTGEVCEQTVTWEMVEKEGWDKKPGSKWQTIRDIMFQYRSATYFGRVFCPEALMGLMTKDELDDMGRQIPGPVNGGLSLKDKLAAIETPSETSPEKQKSDSKNTVAPEPKHNPLHDTPEWKEWLETKSEFPDEAAEIVSKHGEPGQADHCLQAIRMVGQLVDMKLAQEE